MANFFANPFPQRGRNVEVLDGEHVSPPVGFGRLGDGTHGDDECQKWALEREMQNALALAPKVANRRRRHQACPCRPSLHGVFGGD